MAIVIDSRALRASIKRLNEALFKPTNLYADASRHMRDYVRETISLSGRSRPFARLSTWTVGRTGRRKPLITLRSRIKASWDSKSGVVYFDAPSDEWNLDQHHAGYTSPAVSNKRMVIPAHGGGILAFIKSRKAARTPARKVWPTVRELEKEIQPIVKRYLDETTRRTWR